MVTLSEEAAKIGALLEKKNAAYGNVFEQTAQVLRVLFPNGVAPVQYQDLLTITRIIDKLFRIANDKNAFSEDPWSDIAGYAILSLWSAKRQLCIPVSSPKEEPYPPGERVHAGDQG